MANIERFISIQQECYSIALHEITQGQKLSHWMWYIFPQLKGLGSSLTAQQWAIEDLQEAKDYINNAYLRENLIEITRALLPHNNDIEYIMGYPDNLKLQSCMTLFEAVAPEIPEFKLVLKKFYNGKRCEYTLRNI